MSVNLLDELLLRHQSLIEDMQGLHQSTTEKSATTCFRPLEEINQQYFETLPAPPAFPDNGPPEQFPEEVWNMAFGEAPPKKSKPTLGRIRNITFWTIFIFAFLGIFIFSSSGNRNVFGCSFFEVLTTSMQSEIPKGSLVVVKKAESGTIKQGDDITFLIDSKGTTVTHRVVSIIDNYNDTGQPGFQTQGIENPSPDLDIVHADNMVGKVIWHLPFFGQTITWVKTNWWICAIIGGGIILSVVAIKILFKKESIS